ncbi:hypothetical protein RHSIM_Rhsim10G0184300 [Rhododendron simsii]|uniref:F-box domain-containing protein n=1 Tax=Rhododendron simsii TaxID=118357 RepID=A0A834GEW0_RHOSS|nr:hypothetical protein RHSIM_Rhsim10G0184300 [Rhododendron simsii]
MDSFLAKYMSKKIVLSNNKSKLSLTRSAEIIASNVDLLTEILLRVPAKSLIRFKSVSKQWLSLISDTQFNRNHTQQNPSPPISGLYFYSNRDGLLSLNDRTTGVSFHDHPRTTLPNFSFLDGSGSGSDQTTVRHSSNGLMLCTITYPYDYVVCNLTTQKFVVLPKLVVSEWYLWLRSQYYYLIYDPKKSPYYKVVVASFARDDFDNSHINVYSSESGSWKSGSWKGTVASTPRIRNIGLVHTAIWNGAIFWMSCRPGPESCSEHDHFYIQFDVDAERRTTIGVPSFSYSRNGILNFGECGGHLLLIQIPCYEATEFRVLEMMDGENKFRWTVKYIVDLKHLPLPPSSTSRFTVITVTNVGANENDLAVVFYFRPNKVIQYNIKRKTMKVLCDLADIDIPSCSHFIESLTPVLVLQKSHSLLYDHVYYRFDLDEKKANCFTRGFCISETVGFCMPKGFLVRSLGPPTPSFCSHVEEVNSTVNEANRAIN